MMNFSIDQECDLYQLSSVAQTRQAESEYPLAERILIIGSGVLECTLAIDLAREGKEVTILEYSDEILKDCFATSKRTELMRQLEKLVVMIFLENACIKVENNLVCLRNEEGFESFLTIDQLIVRKKL
ncbi:NAD-binding protein [Enterococcus ureilyticus]|uniref:NAD-binding protein n=1 Tax=Enterococcus ureilyticus TaxID=1131292 RepID=UPI001A90D4A6|nr:NAD-binding protein [Enterococcus ureilyticus]MBO0446137.1 NAD-binding protein [Enterococcus ureilyticus]